MKFDEMAVLLPCHSLDDFPTYLAEPDAGSLLAAWSALWHPLLLAHTKKLPTWYRADITPDQPGATLFTLPSPSESLLPVGWTDRVEAGGGRVIVPCQDRASVVSEALAAVEATDGAHDTELAADFLALGYGYLQVDVLTRQMRYMPSLDESQLGKWVVEAATAFEQGNYEAVAQPLGRCFEMLLEARERFYPVDAYLIDVTLLTESTSAAAIDHELGSPVAVNVACPAGVLDALAETAGEALGRMKAAVSEDRVHLVGGEFDEGPLPLEDPEAPLARLQVGLDTFEHRLGKRPLVYGRRRAGLTPLLPQWLSRLGYIGALHFTLDDGHFRKFDQSKTRWEGVDGSTIDAFARLPVDGRLDGSFLALSVKLAESMDFDHVAALAIAHWAGESSPYYGDLRRISRYEPVFGKFVGVEDFFTRTDTAGRLTHSKVDDYRVPYLVQESRAAAPRPISGGAERQTDVARRLAVSALTTTTALLTGEVAHCDDVGSEVPLREATARLAAVLPRGGDAHRGVTVFNPMLERRRTPYRFDDWQGAAPVGESIIAAQVDGDVCRAVIDVPALGFVWIDEQAGRSYAHNDAPAEGQRLAEATEDGYRLANEHLTVVIDQHTGGIRSLRGRRDRSNRLSQQLALREPPGPAEPGSVWRDPDEAAFYSVMVADEITVTSSGPAVGEIVARGRLVDHEGHRLAGFAQTVSLARGSQVMHVDVELACDTLPTADPWNAYYASRWAWDDPGAELLRSVGLGRFTTEARRIEAPHFIEINESPRPVTLLSGGLPYHRRCGMRMLDTLLVVAGEQQRRFRLAVGVDLAHPAREAMALVAPSCWTRDQQGPLAAGPVGWFFHVDAKNVVATHWEPINAVPTANDISVEKEKSVGDEAAAGDPSRPPRSDIVGFRVRLLETEGRSGQVTLQAYRAIAAAQQVDFRGEVLAECTVRDGAAVVETTRYEWVLLEVFWAN
ncbi:MAG: hypothetical protein KDA63_11275 [Planctomycetales bacterium]|nr:hypothetical protein [Planctomycetales bacterium]